MKIDLNVLGRQFALHQAEYEEAALRVLRSGRYILGQEGEAFEAEFAQFLGRKFCVGVASGLDALTLSLRAMGIGPGDEVIAPANTYIASILAITENGARPVFVEPDKYHAIDPEKIEGAITKKTRALMVVHLYGLSAQMDAIADIAKRHRLEIVEDCAQSHGAMFDGKMTGAFGKAGCFSFYPTKNLGAFGDAGAVATDDEDFAVKLRKLRNYGSAVKYHHEITGVNSRLDELQAALLRVKLRHLPELTSEREKIAKLYLESIKNPHVALPELRDKCNHVWHQFVVRVNNRDAFQNYLQEMGIATMIHYPIPPHMAECYKSLGHQKGDFPFAETLADEVLSLPMFNGEAQEEIAYVVQVINAYGK